MTTLEALQRIHVQHDTLTVQLRLISLGFFARVVSDYVYRKFSRGSLEPSNLNPFLDLLKTKDIILSKLFFYIHF
jgi:hypothetical protein